MEARELRIGNLINAPFYDEPIEVHSVCSATNDIYNRITGEIPIDTISPIPLTLEWLLKFGLEEHDGWDGQMYFVSPENSQFQIYESLQCYEYDYTELEYVHQLQNLYFILTGEELKNSLTPTTKNNH